MNTLSEKRCFNHAGREAVALCRECRNFFCRECVTEHDGRVLCAACLAAAAGADGTVRRRVSLWRPLAAAVSLAVLWLCFIAVGRGLLELPDSFHDGAFWAPGPLEDAQP